jgi:cytoskeletal protein CcmA (bactofilin family)
MAQIIKHRRGSISQLKDVTAKAGELVMATGSVNDLNGPFIFIGESENAVGGYRPVSKLYSGNQAPAISSLAYGTVLDGTPYYAVGNETLYILASGGNTALDLTGNIEGNTISGVTINNLVSTNVSASFFTGSFVGDGSNLTNIPATGVTGLNLSRIASGAFTASLSDLGGFNINTDTSITGALNVSGSLVVNGNTSFTGSLVVSSGSATFDSGLVAQNSDLLLTSGSNIKIQDGGNLQVAGDASVSGALYVSGNIYQTGSFYTQGDIVLSGSINIGNSLTGDTINFGGEVNSHIIPTTNDTFDLGTSAKAWKDLYVSGTAYIDQLNLGSIQLTNLTLPGTLIVSGQTSLSGSVFIENTLTVTGNTTVNGDFLANGSNSTLTANFGGNNIELNAYNGATIDLNGPTTINGGLTVTGTTNVNSSLNVTGVTTLYSATTINAGLTVTGTTDLNSSLNVTGATTLYSATTINADLTVTGSTTLSGSISVEDLTEKRLVVVGVDGLLTDYTGLTFDNGNLNVSGAIEVTNIQGTGSLYLKPDLDDPRLFEIYNSAGPSGYTDIHFVGNADLNFFGDDTNYLKIDDTAQTVSIVGVNGVFVSSSLTVTGSVNVSGSASITGAFTVASGSMTSLGGDLYVSGNLQVLGSATEVHLQSQTVELDDNIIRLNAYSPFQRYAGFEVIDSGSTGESGSMVWDSQNDYWMFVSSSGQSSKFVGTTAGTYGSETSLTSGTFPIASGNNTIGNSLLTYSGTTLAFNNNKFTIDSTNGNTTVNGSVTLSYSGGTDSGSYSSYIVFRNNDDVLGFVGSNDTTNVTDRLLGYNSTTGVLEFSSLIDGGTY